MKYEKSILSTYCKTNARFRCRRLKAYGIRAFRVFASQIFTYTLGVMGACSWAWGRARAGVNRLTFYLHYENTADLLKEAVAMIHERYQRTFPNLGLDSGAIAGRAPRKLRRS